MSKGIVNPWAKPDPETQADSRGLAAFATPSGDLQTQEVVFEGRAYSVTVPVLHRKGLDPVATARTVLGAALKDLAKHEPATRRLLETQSLHATAPLGPKVEMALGETTLFAKASSSDLATATRMALDRLALVLTELRAAHPAARSVLETYAIVVSRKA